MDTDWLSAHAIGDPFELYLDCWIDDPPQVGQLFEGPPGDPLAYRITRVLHCEFAYTCKRGRIGSWRIEATPMERPSPDLPA